MDSLIRRIDTLVLLASDSSGGHSYETSQYLLNQSFGWIMFQFFHTYKQIQCIHKSHELCTIVLKVSHLEWTSAWLCLPNILEKCGRNGILLRVHTSAIGINCWLKVFNHNASLSECFVGVNHSNDLAHCFDSVSLIVDVEVFRLVVRDKQLSPYLFAAPHRHLTIVCGTFKERGIKVF